MPAEMLPFPGWPAVLSAFLLLLARVGGLFVFLPLPGMSAVLAPARIVAALSLAALLLPFTLRRAAEWDGARAMVAALFSESVLGAGLGVIVLMLTEAMALGAQFAATQAGFSYATTIDPNSSADAGLLPAAAQWMAGLLFFATGLDSHLVAALVRSIEIAPPGVWSITPEAGEAVVRRGAAMFSLALRLALPLTTLFLLLDVALALAGRVSQQLQLLNVAFPAKTLLTLLLLGMLAPAVAALYESQAASVLLGVEQLLRIR